MKDRGRLPPRPPCARGRGRVPLGSGWSVPLHAHVHVVVEVVVEVGVQVRRRGVRGRARVRAGSLAATLRARDYRAPVLTEAASTIARMPARRAGGRSAHAPITRARSASVGASGASGWRRVSAGGVEASDAPAGIVGAWSGAPRAEPVERAAQSASACLSGLDGAESRPSAPDSAPPEVLTPGFPPE